MHEWIEKYQPHIYRDSREPFPIRYIGCTVFTHKERSLSFPKWEVDPAAEGLKAIIEYAIYYDYDIQHLYDLEHIWVGIDESGAVADCWCSFHGMRLRAAGVPFFRVVGTHPVLYAQPGKHAMLPNPELFGLHPQFATACGESAGGGLLIPDFLMGTVTTDDAQDEKIRAHICKNYTFVPSLEFVREELTAEQFVSWPQLLKRIPQLLKTELEKL